LQVEKKKKLPQGAQDIILKYAQRFWGRQLSPAAHDIDMALDMTGDMTFVPWAPVEEPDFAALEEVSEYASWVLVNGNRLNHGTISVHRLQDFRYSRLSSRCLSVAAFCMF